MTIDITVLSYLTPLLAVIISMIALASTWLRKSGATEEQLNHIRTRVNDNEDTLQSVNTKITAIEVKVDTMWDFTLRRAKGEAILKGFGTINSPLIFNKKAEEAIAPFAQQLRSMYEQLGQISEIDLAVEIERLFGQQLLIDVCIPNGLNMGACLLIAIEAAKGTLACPT